MKRIIIIEGISILFMILFLYTGISKLVDYAVFKEQIATSPLLAPVARYIAFLLPTAEFMVALLLFVTRWRIKGLYASLSLMILFTGYIIAMLTFNDQIPCSCGGVLEELSWKDHIIFNSLFIALALTAIILKKQIKKETQIELVGSVNQE